MSDHNWRVELNHTWPLLHTTSASEISTSPLPLAFESLKVRLGLDGVKARHLLIPVVDSAMPATDAKDGNVMVRLRLLKFGGITTQFLDLSCKRPDLFDLFDEVVVEILETLAEGDTNPARTAIQVLERWRDLFATRSSRLLTLTAQMSLIAELQVLDLAAGDGAIAIETWRGPLREPHDVLRQDCALEVKAVGGTSTHVEIHGLTQLEPPGVPLALVLVTVVESTEAGRALGDYVDVVLAQVDNRAEALRRLGAAGYSPGDKDKYPQLFEVVQIDHLVVGPEVPRIVPSSFESVVPTAISAVRYRLEIAALVPLMLQGPTALTAWLGSVAT